MRRIFEVTVLAAILSLTAALEAYEYSQDVLLDIHNYDYDAVKKFIPINTDSVAEFKFDEAPDSEGSVRFTPSANPENDGNCGGHLGLRISKKSQIYCLKSIEVFVDTDMRPKVASMILTFSRSVSQIKLSLPLFKESSDWKARRRYEDKVLELEPVTFEQVDELRKGQKTVDFDAPWLKTILEEPVDPIPGSDVYVTYPVVMPADTFVNLLKLVQESDE